jgi:hypothetical protein
MCPELNFQSQDLSAAFEEMHLDVDLPTADRVEGIIGPSIETRVEGGQVQPRVEADVDLDVETQFRPQVNRTSNLPQSSKSWQNSSSHDPFGK